MAEHESSNKKQGDISRKHRIIENDSKTAHGLSLDSASNSLSIGETPFLPPMEKHVELLSNALSGEHRFNLAMQLQQTYGNRYVQRLMKSMVVQAKLTVNPPNDVYEQEADRVADAVTNSPAPAVRKQTPEEDEENLQAKHISQIQRQANPDEEEVQTKPAHSIQRQLPEEDEEQKLQVKSDISEVPEVTDNLEQRIKSAQVGGEPLPDTVRGSLEPQFGQDFSGVRVHTDSESSKLSRELSAEAFTTGKDVFFGEGRYQPETDGGKKLLAHELTHVVQQGISISIKDLGEKSRGKKQDQKPTIQMPNTKINTADLKLKRRKKQNDEVGNLAVATAVIQTFGEEGHEDIENKALKGFTPSNRKEISLGNWQNDFNQISLINPMLKKFIGLELSQEDLFAIASIIAEAKFGEKTASIMTKDLFGSYKEAQHFDNPSKSNDELGQEAVPKYIKDTSSDNKSGVSEIKTTLQNALSSGNTATGRYYYGSALHIMEDFFAHTNFVEIALNLKGVSVNTQAGKVESGPDEGKFRLVSGIFETMDSVVSILKIISEYLEKPANKGEGISIGDRITIIFLRRYNPALGITYEKYLDASELVSSAVEVAKQYIPIYNELSPIAKEAKSWASSIISNLIAKLINVGASMLTAKTGTGTQPSHSKLSKDAPADDDTFRTQRFNLAKKLAVYVEQEINRKMFTAWQNPQNPEALFTAVDGFMEHPQKCTWWEPIVEEYKNQSMSKKK